METHRPDSASNNSKEGRLVPVFGLETAIYTIPSTSTSLLYVSKADTTGLLSIPAPSRVLVDAYLQYYFQNPPHDSNSLRIHVFARAQDQYLFPGSIDNKGKRVLPDNVLCRWWREVLGSSAIEARKNPVLAPLQINLYYLLGGFDFGESLAVLSKAPESSEAQELRWQYGHPYSKTASPLPVPDSSKVTINDLIPSFQDDPKARQMTEWASSPMPYAGQDGDYDEIAEEIRKLADSSPVLHDLRSKEIQEQKDQERRRLIKDSERDIDGFWEVMGNRGECASGHVAGFFVVVSDRSVPSDTSIRAAQEIASITAATDNASNKSVVAATPGSLPHSAYIRLWSQIHNNNYSSLEKASEGYAKWSSDLKHACIRTGATDQDVENSVSGSVEVDNSIAPSAESLKRSEPPKQVNTLQVKKKKKVV